MVLMTRLRIVFVFFILSFTLAASAQNPISGPFNAQTINYVYYPGVGTYLTHVGGTDQTSSLAAACAANAGYGQVVIQQGSSPSDAPTIGGYGIGGTYTITGGCPNVSILDWRGGSSSLYTYTNSTTYTQVSLGSSSISSSCITVPNSGQLLTPDGTKNATIDCNSNATLDSSGDLTVATLKAGTTLTSAPLIAAGSTTTATPTSFLAHPTTSVAFGHGYADETALTATVANGGYASFSASIGATYNAVTNHYNGYQFFPTLSGSTTLDTLTAAISTPTINSGLNVTSLTDYYADEYNGLGTVSTHVGLYLGPFAKASNNWGIVRVPIGTATSGTNFGPVSDQLNYSYWTGSAAAPGYCTWGLSPLSGSNPAVYMTLSCPASPSASGISASSFIGTADTSGVPGNPTLQLTLRGLTNPNYQLRAGVDTTTGLGVIQSETAGSAYTNLQLNPQGGIVLAGGTTSGYQVCTQAAGNCGNIAATQTTLSCSSTGSVTLSEPFAGSSYKEVLAVYNGCTGTIASYTFPVAFTNTPDYVGSYHASGLVSTINTTAVTLLAPTGCSSNACFVDIKGY